MPSTPPPPPAVQTLALRYAKRGPLRFASHRVIQRTFERAVRRASLPVAFSAGFTPHPRLSYLGAAPTGAASEAEYMLIRLAEELPPDQVRDRTDRAMPRDLPVVDACVWDSAAHGDIAKLLTASAWRIRLDHLSPSALTASVARFLALESYEAEQLRPGPPGGFERSPGRRGVKPARRIEVRKNVLAMTVQGEPAATPPGLAGPGPGGSATACAILDVVLRHATPAVRPDDVIAALVVNGLEIGLPPCATRLAQGEYSVEAGVIQEPFSRIRV
jgi:radical SAM-linked protein